MTNIWQHLERGISASFQAELDGFRAIIFTSPTGGGKRRAITEMVKITAAEGKASVVYSNRRIITKQTTTEFAQHGIDHGMIAAGYTPELAQEVNIASVQTVWRRRGNLYLPHANRVFIDEAHNAGLHWLVPEYLKRGATVFLFTATPIGMKGVADHLVVAGTNSELRKIGALVVCSTYSPETPGIKGVRRWKVGKRYSEKHRKWFNEYQTEVFSCVFREWNNLNPFALPTILFAPGVAESRWIVGEFERLGVPAAHIDGSTSESEREDIEGKSRDGTIKVVSSCGVMREGADWAWLRHAIGLQAWIDLKTYLQSIGRVLRAFEGKAEATFQDHSGSFFRHGSPNEDRVWSLEDTEITLARRRFEGFRTGKVPEPIRCPKCGMERKSGDHCYGCGFKHEKSVRIIRMGSGKLIKVSGPLMRAKPKTVSTEQSEWIKCLFACARSGRTLRQLAGMYKGRSGKWPDGTLRPAPPPHGSMDWLRKVEEVYPRFAGKEKAQ